MGHGVPWGNCKVLYQDLPFNQDREHEVLMTQFEQGYLDPKGCRKSSAHQRTWPENSSPSKGKAKRTQGAVGFGQTHLSMVTMSLGMSHWLCPQRARTGDMPCHRTSPMGWVELCPCRRMAGPNSFSGDKLAVNLGKLS